MIQEVGKIKTEEEYKVVEERLAREISEYKSINQAGSDPKRETEDKLRSEMAKLNGYEDRETLKEIERLRAKIELLKDGSYEAKLRQNITGLMLMKEEYDAQKEKMSFKDIIVGLAKGTPEVKEYLRKKYMLSFSNMYAVTAAPVSLDVEPIGAILNRMIRECNLVEITEEDIVAKKEETSLVPVDAAVSGIRQAIVARIDTMFKECVGQEYVAPEENYSHNAYDKAHNLDEIKRRSGKKADRDNKKPNEGEIER